MAETTTSEPTRPSQMPPSPSANQAVNRLSYGSLRRDRLPTLQEVLTRKTRPPVDLYCFYLYLQRERAEDALDFWLDAHQHENLCRAYFRDLRRADVPLEQEWPAYYERARTRGSVYNGPKGNGIRRMREGEGSDEEGEGAEKRDEKGMQEARAQQTSPYSRPSNSSSAQSVNRTTFARTPSPGAFSQSQGGQSGSLSHQSHFSPTMRALFPHDANEGKTGEGEDYGRRKSGGGNRPVTPAQPVIPRSSAITRTDLIASAERIFHRYLLSGAEKEIYLPPQLRIHDFPVHSGRLPQAHVGKGEEWEDENRFLAEVPDLFVNQKEYVYRSMEQDTFPRFLRSKAFGNLTALGALFRLVVGLVALWAALSTAFALIFLDVEPRRVRFWIILPFAVGVLYIVTHFYDLDPLLMVFNRSETTPFRTLKVEERYVRKILRGRAVWVVVLTTLVVTALCAIFISVPGHRI